MTYEELQKANQEIKTTDIKGKDYAEVNQRIKAFRMLHPNGCISTEIISLENGVCVIKAIVSDAEGKLLGTGTAYEKEGSTFINKTSFIENCETSAVGRALGMVGIGIDASVSSYEEVSNAIAQQEQQNQPGKKQPSKEEAEDAKETEKIAKEKIGAVHAKALEARCKKEGVPIEMICKLYKVNEFSSLTNLQYRNINDHWNQILEQVKK